MRDVILSVSLIDFKSSKFKCQIVCEKVFQLSDFLSKMRRTFDERYDFKYFGAI